MHLKDLITPDDLLKEFTKPDAVVQQKAVDDVACYMPVIEKFLMENYPPPMAILLASGAMTMLQSLECILAGKVKHGDN